MNEAEKNFLTLARELLMGEHTKDACAHYYKVREANPENAEAKFFAAYCGYEVLLEERDYLSAKNAFLAMTKETAKIITCFKEAIFEKDEDSSDIPEDEFQEISRNILLTKTVDLYTPLTRFIFTNRISTTKEVIEGGVLSLYAMGDAIEKEFAAKPEFMKEALKVWKEGVALQTQFYGYKYEGVVADTYVAKIQKIEPSYTKPQKTGCISLKK